MIEYSTTIAERVSRLLGAKVMSAQRVDGGFTPAARWIVTTPTQDSFFVKMATTQHTAEALRSEYSVYSQRSFTFTPELIAWEDDPAAPLLILEDLQTARWPPPWDDRVIREVFLTLRAIHSTSLRLKSFEHAHGGLANGWHAIAENPEPFLALQLASPRWLQRSLASLVRAGDQVQTAGKELLHFDVRSGNLCRAPRGIVFVDWAWACIGNGDLDTGFWLPSLHTEGGPQPEKLLPDRADIAAWVSGFFGARAGLPPIPGAPGVRELQLSQLRPALDWAVRELQLPEPSQC